MTYFFTGPRNVGKSTALRRGLADCPRPMIGLMTRFGPTKDGERKLYLLPWSVLNRREAADSDAPVCARMNQSGKTVYPQVFDRAGEALLRQAAEQPEALIVLDELGFLEQDAQIFHAAVLELMHSRTVVGVVRDGLGAWQDAPFDRLLTVSEENRHDAAAELRAYLADHGKRL